MLPHALLELTAVFLPLAAWLIASRRDEWEELLAATFVTVALALPMLLVAALVELTIWPLLLEAVSPVRLIALAHCLRWPTSANPGPTARRR